MRELFNFCFLQNYERELLELKLSLKEYACSMELDGAEMFVYDNSVSKKYLDSVTGVHLRYWPFWIGFWLGDYRRMHKQFTTEDDKFAYYEAYAPSQWLDVIRSNIKQALIYKPQYLVWHVSEADIEEIYTMRYAYSDLQVIEASVDVFNAVAAEIPSDVTVLFENLWWPGLRLNDKTLVQYLLDNVRHDNVGIMLDLGHLANTNAQLRTQDEIIDYAIKIVNDLGKYAYSIKGMHLSKSLSGIYQHSFLREVPKDLEQFGIFKHIAALDQHRPFTSDRLQELVKVIAPDYLVHELYYSNLRQMRELVALQQKALGHLHHFGG